MIHERLYRLRYERLKDVALYRQPEACHFRDMRGMAGNGDAGPACEDPPPRRLDACDLAVVHDEALDFAVLDDVDPERVRGPRIAPSHSVMAGPGPPAPGEGAPGREARLAGGGR